MARRRHGRDRQPRHRRQRRCSCRRTRVSLAPAAARHRRATRRICSASRCRRSCRSPPRFPRSAARGARSSCSAAMTERVLFGTHQAPEPRRAGADPARQPRPCDAAMRRDGDARRRPRDDGARSRRDRSSTRIDQIEMRLTIAHVVHAVPRHRARRDGGSGAGVHYLDNELQRIHRDVQMISAHTVFDIDAAALGARTARC